MPNVWKLVALVTSVVLISHFGRPFFGEGFPVVILTAMIFAWWLVNRFSNKRADELFETFKALDEADKKALLEELDPEMRQYLENRLRDEKDA